MEALMIQICGEVLMLCWFWLKFSSGECSCGFKFSSGECSCGFKITSLWL